MVSSKYTNALGIDVGEKRIGFARVNSIAKLPEPLGTVPADEFEAAITKAVKDHDIDLIVVGLPRNMSGQETQQSEYVRSFTLEKISAATNVPLVFQDETLSTVGAEAKFSKKDIAAYGIDSLAAVEILSDFLKGNK